MAFLPLIFLFIGCYHDDERCNEDFNNTFVESQRADRLEEALVEAEAMIARLEDEQAEDQERIARLDMQYGSLWFIVETFIAQSSEQGEFLMVCPLTPLGHNQTPRLAVVDSAQYDPNSRDCRFHAITYNPKTGVPSLVFN